MFAKYQIKKPVAALYRFFPVLLLICLAGCNTLASLGLPFGGGNNKILKSAKAISEAPGQSLALAKELGVQPVTPYIVEIGDTLLIEPVKFDATIRLPGDQVVKPDGFISLGEFGRLSVVNKTIEQIEEEAQSMINARVEEELRNGLKLEQEKRALENARSSIDASPSEPGKQESELPLQSAEDAEQLAALQSRINESILNNEISARLINWESKKIYVLGEVNSPGSFEFIGNETVLDALIEAGGLNSRANRHSIIVARPTPCSSCRIVMKVCYDQIVQLGDTSTNYQLQPGDRVFVPNMTFQDDLKQTILGGTDKHCPRCADCPQACDLPTGCD